MQRPKSKTVRKREKEKEVEKELSLSLWPSLAVMANDQGWKNSHKRSMLYENLKVDIDAALQRGYTCRMHY